MSLTNADKQRYSAALEALECEQKRRDDERVASGAAIRYPHYIVVVRGNEETTEAIKRARARKLADLRAQGIIYDDILEIRTGVPVRTEPDREPIAPKRQPSSTST